MIRRAGRWVGGRLCMHGVGGYMGCGGLSGRPFVLVRRQACWWVIACMD